MRLKFAIVGMGFIGAKHLASIQSHPEAEVVAVCDPFSEESPDHSLPVYKDISSMISAHPGIQVVNICTPNGLHARQAIECIAHGKHVVLEKPMSLTKKEAEQVIFHALNRHVKIFCVMQNRYTANARFLKHLITTDNLGSVREIIVNLYWNRDRRYYFAGDGVQHAWRGNAGMDGGPLFTQFSHFVDLLYWLFGDIEVLDAKVANLAHDYVPDIEDAGFFTFRTGSGADGSFRYSINAPVSNIESSVLILGAKGAIKVSGQYLENIDHYSGDQLLDNEYPILDNTHTHRLVIRNVIDAINSGNDIDTNAIEGMKVVEVIEEVYRKAGKKGLHLIQK